MVELSESAKFRTLRGPLRAVEVFLALALPLGGFVFLLSIPSFLRLSFYTEQYLGFFLALALGLVFLTVPAGKRQPRDRVPWYDLVLAALGLFAGLYVMVFYPQIIGQLGERTPLRVGLGIATILLLLEASRRLVGWVLVIIAGSFLFYALFAYLFPDPFYDRGASVERLATYLYFDSNGIVGQALAVGATTVLAFIFFGQVLYAAGGGRFITDFAMFAVGAFRGGPAKMSIVSSSLFGTISGSAVANVVVDGVINIPLIKRAGYPPHMAGAIEAVASTGGQIMPPVMGAAAFLIAEFLAISYGQVALAALLPAVLFYVALFIQIDLEAAKGGLRGLPRSELPRLGPVLRKSPVFVVPFAVLVVTMFGFYWQAEKCALAAALAAFVISLFDTETRITPSRFFDVLTQTTRGLLDIAVITGLAGIVIGVLSLTGLGFTLAFSLIQIGQGSLLLLLLLAALISIVLGMGLPTTAVYILLAVLLAPALIELGLQPLAAHLFILYYGMLSMITPPICLASFVAASMAGADPMRTGYAGMRLGMLAYIVPFLFVFSPRLLLMGPWPEVMLAVCTAVAGAVLVGVAVVGYLFRVINWPQRGLFMLAGVCLLLPTTGDGSWLFSWLTDAVGVGLGVPLVVWEWRQARSTRTPAPTMPGPSILSEPQP